MFTLLPRSLFPELRLNQVFRSFSFKLSVGYFVKQVFFCRVSSGFCRRWLKPLHLLVSLYPLILVGLIPVTSFQFSLKGFTQLTVLRYSLSESDQMKSLPLPRVLCFSLGPVHWKGNCSWNSWVLSWSEGTGVLSKSRRNCLSRRVRPTTGSSRPRVYGSLDVSLVRGDHSGHVDNFGVGCWPLCDTLPHWGTPKKRSTSKSSIHKGFLGVWGSLFGSRGEEPQDEIIQFPHKNCLDSLRLPVDPKPWWPLRVFGIRV